MDLGKILPQGMQFDFNSEIEKNNEKRRKHLEDLTEDQKSKVDALKEVQKQTDDIEEEFEAEYQKLKEKYDKLKQPLFVKRTDIVNGDSKEKFNGIPNFWLYAMKNSDIFEELNKKDEDSLKYLTNIECKNFKGEDGEGFVLEFHFRENPYFENKTLTKRFYLDDPEKDLVPPKGCEIQWKEGKDLTCTYETKKKKHKGGGKPKIVKKKVPCASFYNFFNSITEEEMDGIEEEEEAQALEEEIEQEYQIGETIRDELIAKAVKYYTGEIESLNPLSQMFSGLNIHGDGEEDEDDEEEGGVKFQELEGGNQQQGDNKECENQQQ